MFLQVVNCNTHMIMLILLLQAIFISTTLCVEYIRRRNFYCDLEKTMQNLQEKYLLADIMEEPDFMDGQILYDTLCAVNKNMLEHVNTYRQREEEYRNYVEMWVHEIKTPLSAGKLIISNNENAITKSIEEELDKVEGFVDQALFYARSTTLEKDYIIKEMTLSSVVNKVLKKHSKSFIYRKIQLETKGLDAVVYSDAKWLEFIIDQIVTNALKYTKEKSGKIRIYTKLQEQSVSLYMEDNGIGISLSDLHRVFDKGFTGQNGRKNEKATGMGLYLCKLLCDKLYLDLHISSQEGIGTTLWIVFPISSMMLLK